MELRETGIIRRMDFAGRLPVPKEIRRNLKVMEGSHFEILMSDDCIAFKIYKFDEEK
jgi:bifunctional DNA-binding transcriptional regulator/antitoxin component of YhaV-PrlF toxin-antitoxin module